MGSSYSFLTPFPPNYIAVTFRPSDELWLCQAPQHLSDFIRCLLANIWPHLDHQERQCNAPERNHAKGDGDAHPALRNTVFRIPSSPFTASPIHQPSVEADRAYRFILILVAYLHSMHYDMVSAGHYVRGTEASTCLFRRKNNHHQSASLNRLMGNSQTYRPKASIRKISKKLDFGFARNMMAVGLEGWNKFYIVNISLELLTELVDELQTVWPGRIAYRQVNDFSSQRDSNDKRMLNVVNSLDTCSSFLVELEGHPWDSYKEHSDLTPYLILRLFSKLDQSGYEFVSRANFRGLLDTLFFRRPKSTPASTNTVARACFSLCHQDTFRVYGGTAVFCTWVSHLLQQLWLSGVANEKRISVVHKGGSAGEAGVKEFKYTEVKLSGTPWCIPEWNKDNFFASQYMLSRFVGVLSLIGWKLAAFMNVYTSPYDKGLLIFEKELTPGAEEKLVDLEVNELPLGGADDDSAPAQLIDFIMPICFTSHDIDRICVLGGSKEFLQSLNSQFLSLFDTTRSTYLCVSRKECLEAGNSTDEGGTKSASTWDRWIASRAPFHPHLIHEVYLEDSQVALCLFSPTNDHLALNAVSEIDPNNYLEYVTNYRMWSISSCWPPKMFKRTHAKATKFFHRSQLPLAVLCWVNEIINSSQPIKVDDDAPQQEGVSDQDEIMAIASVDRQAHAERPYANCLVACLDCASTVRNAPPAWIYLVTERRRVGALANKQGCSTSQ
ncbi:unnamed protein product [Mesocestoides corti]|uniref:Pecanex-like protein n=1 Tax=Mesocestoides corti TaxID=53468 RepID=A0A0R3UPT9_MESCO|nr:unnamed protein product [Mesocestoides corti]